MEGCRLLIWNSLPLDRSAGSWLLCLPPLHPFPPLREALCLVLGAVWLFYHGSSVFAPPHFAKQNILIRRRRESLAHRSPLAHKPAPWHRSHRINAGPSK